MVLVEYVLLGSINTTDKYCHALCDLWETYFLWEMFFLKSKNDKVKSKVSKLSTVLESTYPEMQIKHIGPT